MAVPHVAGAIALHMSAAQPAQVLAPAAIKSALLQAATPSRVQDSRMLPHTPNRMLFTGYTSPRMEAAAAAAGGG
jgi:hypothetical protein